MREVLRSNDPVRISFVSALLRSEGIEPVVLDAYTSIAEGSIGVLPRRLMVEDEDYRRATVLLTEAGETGEAW